MAAGVEVAGALAAAELELFTGSWGVPVCPQKVPINHAKKIVETAIFDFIHPSVAAKPSKFDYFAAVKKKTFCASTRDPLLLVTLRVCIGPGTSPGTKVTMY